jgi:hypothetical protein
MLKSLPYRPQMDMQQLHAFDERLRHVPGSWNTIGRSFVHAGAPGVIRLRWLIEGKRWCDEAGFLDFLDQRHHRLLLRCFLQQEPMSEDLQQLITEPGDSDPAVPESGWQRIWKVEALLEKMGPEATRQRLMHALHFLELQEYLVAQAPDEWVSSSLLEHVEHFGPTFAWSVQAHLQQQHHALVRRCVGFKEWQASALNDLDVLAFTEDGLIMVVECKASPDIPFTHLVHYVQRARAFPADISLLLIDTESESLLTEYVQQIVTILNRAPMNLGQRHLYEGSVIYHVTENLYVANTAGGIDPALEITLRLESGLK